MESLNIISLLIIGVLGIICYQDLRYRILDIKYAIILLVLCCWYNAKHPLLNYKDALAIIGFIVLNILALLLYFSVKEKRFTNPIDVKIGLGDIVFFLAVIPLFITRHYILFFISGLLFSLLIATTLKVISKKNKPLPLAGYLSIYLSGIFIIYILFNNTFLNLGNH